LFNMSTSTHLRIQVFWDVTCVSLDEFLFTFQRIKSTYFTNAGTMHPMTPHHIPQNLRAHQHRSANQKSCHLDRCCKRLIYMIKVQFTLEKATKAQRRSRSIALLFSVLEGGVWSTPCPCPLTMFNT